MMKSFSNTETFFPCIPAALLKIQPTIRSHIKLEPSSNSLVSYTVSVGT